MDPKCVCYAWKELRSSGHNLLEEGLEREARNPMVAAVLWAEPWLPVSWPLLCLAIQFSSDALNSSFLFVSGAMGVVAGDSWGQGKQAAQKESWPHKYSPGVLAPVHRAGGARTFSSHTKRSCSHRNQCRAEWAAWFCSPFLFLSKSLLEMHCLLVIFVLIKIQTVVKKMLPTARQLALQAHDIHCRRLALWLDLPGSEIGSPFFQPCTDRPPRALAGWDWQANLNTNAARPASREGPEDSIVVSGEREGLLPQLWVSFLLSLPGPFSAGLLASLLSILQGLMPQCKGKIKKQKQKNPPKPGISIAFSLSS